MATCNEKSSRAGIYHQVKETFFPPEVKLQHSGEAPADLGSAGPPSPFGGEMGGPGGEMWVRAVCLGRMETLSKVRSSTLPGNHHGSGWPLG